MIGFGILPTARHLERRRPKPIDTARPCEPRYPSRSRRDKPSVLRSARPATADRRPDALSGA
ncbi:hypothetical protein DF141_04285 [Burkholderia cenocepacia]|nr:hypothetical protein DF147_12925 [Burkholderia cenocepacia]RQU80032.1 hypothetical protein DF141_04285 [Burkholderia cenocepacia]RQV21490.1 hypothetical protein DF132_18120 [Burkholderia cenocepacia]RQV26276.1 hypothetical protein DF039_06225 [Burkholderia cenocepacia]RQV63005.1 hypothetical protein DF024_16160 [Burkholderia cenocepacia]